MATGRGRASRRTSETTFPKQVLYWANTPCWITSPRPPALGQPSAGNPCVLLDIVTDFIPISGFRPKDWDETIVTIVRVFRLGTYLSDAGGQSSRADRMATVALSALLLPQQVPL